MPDLIGTDTTKKKGTSPSQESEIKRTQSVLKAAEGKSVTETKDVKTFKKASGIPKAKPHKVAEEKTKKKKETPEPKKNESSLAASKKAQRAKGSLAIGRTEFGAQKARSLSMTEKLSHRGGAGEKQKDADRTSRGKLRTMRAESEKSALDVKKKSTAEVLSSESESEEVARKESLAGEKMDEETPTTIEEVPEETAKDKEISPSNVPSYPYSTCSFFEKIQQGVKAYFSSRNSLGAKSSAEGKKEPKVTEGGIDLG